MNIKKICSFLLVFMYSLAAYSHATTTVAQTQELLASDPDFNAQFGVSVSIHCSTAIVGAPLDNTKNGEESGSAYIFKNTKAGWQQVAKLTALFGQINDNFGTSVSIHGNFAIVGAPFHANSRGAAYIFKKIKGKWFQIAQLEANDGNPGDFFGFAVSIDKNIAIISAPLADGKVAGSGAAYIFRPCGNTWQQVSKLTAFDGALGDNFGFSVSIDNNTALIGAPADDDAGISSGSAYIFQRIHNHENLWMQTAKLTAQDAAVQDRFGLSVSLDKDTAVIGAPFGANIQNSTGSAYIFQKVCTAWKQVAKLVANDGEVGDLFGQSVSISKNQVLIGSLFDNSAYLFEKRCFGWKQVAKVTGSDAEQGSGFGISVSLTHDFALVGAPFHTHPSTPILSGAAYLFKTK